MRLKMFQVDAFTSRVFGGNPAGVVPLQEWIDDATMQSIATENNLSETAFFVPKGADFHLRWFTPTAEIPLCGHATLASGFIMLTMLDPSRKSVRFETMSGALEVRRGEGDLLQMDFPRREPKPGSASATLLDGLKAKPLEVLTTDGDKNFYAVYATEREVRSLEPDMGLLAALPHGVAVTAPGEDADFVSRYFVPSYGIPEDPVTGSTHCALVPLWAKRLGKSKLYARQVSKRGGELYCEDLAERVLISGRAVKFLEGDISIP